MELNGSTFPSDRDVMYQSAISSRSMQPLETTEPRLSRSALQAADFVSSQAHLIEDSRLLDRRFAAVEDGIVEGEHYVDFVWCAFWQRSERSGVFHRITGCRISQHDSG